jgi:hypothetical protein
LTFARNLALRIPAVRRLYDSRNALLQERASLFSSQGSPFFHYNAGFDPQEAMRRHAVANPQPHPGYLTNFLGVLIDPKYFPGILDGTAGTVEPIPIPANWHSDIAEWGAALRAVDLARDSFTMIELGCGWGCWMNNTGSAARRLGLDVFLIGVEGDPGHIVFAQESTAANGFKPSQVALHHGIAAAEGGTALFPRQNQAGASWGSAPIFGASQAEQALAAQDGTHDSLKMIPLAELAASKPRIDLLHVDIQGGEADLIASSRSFLSAKVAYLVIGTHSRQIEGELFETLLGAGWQLEIERPAILSIGPGAPTVYVDGVQGWRNPLLLPQ